MQATIKRVRRENLDLRSHIEASSAVEDPPITTERDSLLTAGANMPYRMTCRDPTCPVGSDDQMRRSSKTNGRFPHFKGASNLRYLHMAQSVVMRCVCFGLQVFTVDH